MAVETAPTVRTSVWSRRTLTALTAVLGLLAAVAVQARPAGAITSHSRTSYESSIAWAVERQLNAERRAHHLPALTMSSQLQTSARWHDMTMARYDAMSHQLPGEAVFSTRILRAGYHWRWAGENIGWNSRVDTAGVLALQTTMYNEKAPDDGHRRNILSTHFRNVGVDVYVDSAHHKIWLTTDFGSR